MILRLVVREYVATGRPVSSKTLVEHSGSGSRRPPSATRWPRWKSRVSGAFAHLWRPDPDRSGVPLLCGASHGRLRASSSEQLTILHQFRQVELQLEQWIELAAATLARAAGNVSLVSAPIPQSPRLRHIELVSLQPRLGLVILVTTDGAVRQVMVHWPEDADQETLSPLADNLASSLRGLVADEVSARAPAQMGWHGQPWTRSRPHCAE